MSIKTDAVKLLEEAICELEKTKGSPTTGVQEIRRAADMVEEKGLAVWCAIQLGEEPYISKMREILASLKATGKNGVASDQTQRLLAEAEQMGIDRRSHLDIDEVMLKMDKAGGGCVSISFVEGKHGDFVRTKTGNDGTYYKDSLLNHLTYVRTEAHKRASCLLRRLKYSDTARGCFDLLREAVDDRLLDLDPTLAEQLMLAFQSVSSSKPESWSQSLTTCRRLLEGLADALYPARNEPVDGRKLGKQQYINRLWAFMDAAIESETNKELAKTHVDFLGAWLESTHNLTHKGVHASVQRLEAVKAVFHTYLVVADILAYLRKSPATAGRPNVNDATLDEIEAILGVSRATAKEIVKARVQAEALTPELLNTVRGVGPKTLSRAVAAFSFDKK